MCQHSLRVTAVPHQPELWSPQSQHGIQVTGPGLWEVMHKNGAGNSLSKLTDTKGCCKELKGQRNGDLEDII